MNLFSRRRKPAPAPSTDGGAPDRLRLAIAGARARDGAAFEELIAALPAAAPAGRSEDRAAALGLLTEHPELLLRLDAFLRREPWYPAHPASSLPLTGADPVALALAASHPDGRVREDAVRRMLDRPRPELIPVLVLRTSDWVRQVREPACGGLAVLLHDDPRLATPAAVRTALLVNRRRRGAFAHDQLRAALLAGPAAPLSGTSLSGTSLSGRLLTAPEPAVRRFALDTTAHRLGLRDLTALAENDPDRQIRARAAEAAARQALWTDQADLLRRLARSRHAEVRIAALTGLMRAGSPQDVLADLDDPSALVRALAREAARRTGTDPLAHYRTAVRADEPRTGAIAGLAETGSRTDGPLLTALLDNPAAPVRAQALRALRSLDAVPVPRATALLRDASGTVVKEAATALIPSAAQVPADLLGELLTDPHRPAARRAGYRLLARHDRPTALRAALVLSADPHPGLAARGRTDAIARIRGLAPRRRLADPAPPLDASPALAAELLALAGQPRTGLPEDAVRLLHDLLHPVPGAR
ncbi:hypothetical protein ACFVVX_36275 [Kitasatospora sp. NPDC058170]|uniref:hypothetical protein n=1 Tax=Kitasatospora sp. NPDC058170 TaxID=3346364 RepID=UPI0036D7BB84